MSDRTSAGIFGDLFRFAAKQNPPDTKLGKELWKMQRGYDFSPCQMGADKELLKLGLATCAKDADGYEEWTYGPRGSRS